MENFQSNNTYNNYSSNPPYVVPYPHGVTNQYPASVPNNIGNTYQPTTPSYESSIPTSNPQYYSLDPTNYLSSSGHVQYDATQVPANYNQNVDYSVPNPNIQQVHLPYQPYTPHSPQSNFNYSSYTSNPQVNTNPPYYSTSQQDPYYSNSYSNPAMNNFNSMDYFSYIQEEVNTLPPLDTEQIARLNEFGITFEADAAPSPFKQQASKVPELMLLVQSDPRYRRLLFKYSPSKTTKKGLIQYAKTKIDPNKIPGFGVVVDIFRSGKMVEFKKEFADEKFNVDYSVDDISNVTMNSLAGCIDAQLTKQSVKTTLGMAFNWIPFISLLPGTGIKFVAYKGGEKVVNKQHQNDSKESEIMGDYKVTKAFLFYLGYPETDDNLYSPWEKHRIALKKCFGAKPEENYYKMSYDVWKGDEETRNSNSIPLLLLLWYIYHCEREQYYSKIYRTIKKYSVEDLLRMEREEDAKWLSFDPSFEHDPHCQIVFEEREDAIVNILVNEYTHSSLYHFLQSTDGTPQFKIEWCVRALVRYFIEQKQIWAYVEDDECKTIRAVILWQSPNSYEPVVPFGKFTKLKALSTLGRDLSRILKERSEYVRNLNTYHLNLCSSHPGVIHYFGFWHDADDIMDYSRYFVVLLYNIVNSHSQSPIYTISPIEHVGILTEIGFRPLPTLGNGDRSIVGLLYERNNNSNNNYSV